MIFRVGETLAYISRNFTINRGDLLATGTPSGVGYARTPPWLLHPGDVVEVEIERLGVLTNHIVDNTSRHTTANSGSH
jgi:2-keto-4-pentenoate hydratase/2-oxohepta-3-ene-1,7-dioic acid hydratase in catechol pathway